MKISYAITVCNELDEIIKLLNFLLKHRRKQDEIVVLFDKGNGQKEKMSHDQFSVTDLGKEEPEQEAPAPNIITLAEEDGIKATRDLLIKIGQSI